MEVKILIKAVKEKSGFRTTVSFLYYFLLVVFSNMVFAENTLYPQFRGETPNSTLSMNFNPVNVLLEANVIDMGPSKRAFAKRSKPPIGTRLRSRVKVTTHNESNRFTYELINEDHNEKIVSSIKEYLESLPNKRPLNLFTKEEQLAYWLNLYNVTVINEIVKRYPRVPLEDLLTNSDDSLLNRKLIMIDGVKLSLNNIQHDILDNNYGKNPLIFYGLYQGNIGGPNITKNAYSGSNVFKELKKNAERFVNSNIGASSGWGNSLNVSSYYSRNAEYFPNFDEDLKYHLLQFADKKTKAIISKSSTINPSINNWAIADLYGSIRLFGEGVATNPAAAMGAINDQAFIGRIMVDSNNAQQFKLNTVQLTRLKELMKVRAKNFGTTSVTVTDLEPEELH